MFCIVIIPFSYKFQYNEVQKANVSVERMSIVDIRQVEYFVEVSKQKNFTKAAAELHISQPSLSKTIKNLETELGVLLFYRGGKQIDLTDAGKAFLINARQFLDAYNNLTSELDDVMHLKKGEIKIGIPPIIGATFFSKLISKYKEAYPNFNIELNEVGSNTIKQGIHSGDLDIGLICNIPVQKKNFEIIKLLNDPLKLVVQKDHPLAKRTTIEFTDLENQPFVLYQQDFSLYDRIVEACRKHGFEPNIVCKSSQRDFMIEMVEAKLGVALLPSKICQQLTHHDVIAISFKQPPVHLELAMIWKKNKYLPYSVRAFINMSEAYRVD
jgi:DNA-binding transcriptional LysR family regulator